MGEYLVNDLLLPYYNMRLCINESKFKNKPDSDFEQNIKQFIERIPIIKSRLSTEESTKNSLIMPVLNILGYNVFDPVEVNSEYTADFGVKTKEKVDYALMKNNEPIMLIECKPCTTKLGNKQASQLYRYFSVCSAKIGLLTNGLEWMFFSDLDEENKMDKKAFLTLNLEAMTDEGIAQLSKFGKMYSIQIVSSHKAFV